MAEKTFDDALRGLETGAAPSSDAGAPMGESADASSHPSVAALRARFGDAIVHHTVMSGDEHVVYIAAERSTEILRWLFSEPEQRYDLLLDVTCVDWGGHRPLEVVYQLISVTHRRMLRVKATLPLTNLEIDTVVPIWRTADWLEREAYDMFGVHFRGHPDLRRILMPENYAEGHPLRKDFPLRGRFSRAEQTRQALAMPVEEFYTPEELAIGGRPAPSRVPTASSAERGSTGATGEGTPGRPNTGEGWAQGASGSAAAGVPGPGGAGA